jgi:hypothetical protein
MAALVLVVVDDLTTRRAAWRWKIAGAMIIKTQSICFLLKARARRCLARLWMVAARLCSKNTTAATLIYYPCRRLQIRTTINIIFSITKSGENTRLFEEKKINL